MDEFFYDFIRSGLLGRIEVISRKFPNLGIRSGYVLFAFFWHSVAFRGKSNMIYAHTIPHGHMAMDENIRIV